MSDVTPASVFPPATSVRSEMRELLRLAGPVALSHLGLMAMSLVDTAIVGNAPTAGPGDLGGASVGRSLGFATLVFAFGVSSAVDPLASQALGAGDARTAWNAQRATLRAAFFWCIPTSLLSLLLALALPAFRVKPSVAHAALGYVLGHIPGMFAAVAFSTFKGFLQAHGRTRPIFVAAVVANVFNVGICSLLVRGNDLWSVWPLPPLGAAGAGIAVSLASIVMAIIVGRAAWALRPPKAGVSTQFRHADIFRLGAPIGLNSAAEYGVFTLVTVLAARLGETEVGAHQVAIALASFTYMGALGIGAATSVRVGRAVGAGVPCRMPGQLGIALGLAFMTFGAIAFAAFPRALARLFTPNHAIIELSVSLLHIAAFFQLFDGVQVVAASALRGAGDVRIPAVTTMAIQWFVALPFGLACAFWAHLGLIGLWLGLTVGLIAIAAILLVRFWTVTGRPIARLLHPRHESRVKKTRGSS